SSSRLASMQSFLTASMIALTWMSLTTRCPASRPSPPARVVRALSRGRPLCGWRGSTGCRTDPDRKSTRLNSSHVAISYAVFCLNDPATTPTYTLSLHDALPIFELEIGVDAELLDRVDDRADVDVPHDEVPGVSAIAACARRPSSFAGTSSLWVARLHWLPNGSRSEEHTSELQSRGHLVCRLLLE